MRIVNFWSFVVQKLLLLLFFKFYKKALQKHRLYSIK